jgi:hypothetical protein
MLSEMCENSLKQFHHYNWTFLTEIGQISIYCMEKLDARHERISACPI